MKKAAIVVGKAYAGNKLFDLEDCTLNRDNCLYPFYLLKEKLKAHGYDLATSDIHPLAETDIVIYNEMPKVLPSEEEIAKSYLLLFESELIIPRNWDLSKHRFFRKIFTWADNFVDGSKYIKMNFPQNLPGEINFDHMEKNRFCTIIAGNKMVKHNLELYSQRIKAIRWFEAKHPDQFDLYGMGWDNYTKTESKLLKLLRKIKLFERWLKPVYTSYRGKVENKNQVLREYKFSICYENARDIPGYITEKIFDCFFAGCVPVYWGANNVFQYIPSKTFIDRRKFATYEALYQYMSTMKDEEYQAYLENIKKFLESDKFKAFSAEVFADTIVNGLIHE